MRKDENRKELTPKEAADARIYAAMRASEKRQNRGGYLMIGLMAAVVLGGGGFELHALTATPRPAVLTGPLATKNENGRPASGSTTKASTAPKHKTAPKSSPKVRAVGKPVHGVPNFWVAPTGNIFRDIAAINNRYIAWGNHQIAHDVPGIAATGPLAGTLTPSVMNSPAILKKYPGPKVPLSLKAAGVKLPAGTPKNGAVTGLSLSKMSAALKANPWLHVTPQQLMGAYQVAAKWAMATNGNSEALGLQYVDPYFFGNNTQFFVTHELPTWATENGQLASRQVAYQSSVMYNLRPGSYFGAYQLGRDTITGSQPSSIVAHVAILNVRDNIIGTSKVGTRLKIGNFSVTVGYIYMALVRGGNSEHWFVTGMQNAQGTNTPTQVYWTGPQGG